MITIPVEDWVFAVAALLGCVLLLINVVLDDLLGGVLDAIGLGFDVAGTSITPILLGFIGMFGAGGLFATQLLDVHGGEAAVVGLVSGAGGAGIAGVLFGVLRRSESGEPFKLDDLVGGTAFVSVAIPAGRYGSVLVKAEGQTHEFPATAEHDIPAGRSVTVTGTAGNGLIVEGKPGAAAAAAGQEG
jgi:membrane protein implicated in regulation of membrane protease activity